MEHQDGHGRTDQPGYVAPRIRSGRGTSVAREPANVSVKWLACSGSTCLQVSIIGDTVELRDSKQREQALPSVAVESWEIAGDMILSSAARLEHSGQPAVEVSAHEDVVAKSDQGRFTSVNARRSQVGLRFDAREWCSLLHGVTDGEFASSS